MPTYEYACSACGNEFERFENITAKPNCVCPKCMKKKAVRRISAGAGLLFKGSGFYITDYKRGGCAARKELKDTPCAETCKAGAKPGKGQAKLPCEV